MGPAVFWRSKRPELKQAIRAYTIYGTTPIKGLGQEPQIRHTNCRSQIYPLSVLNVPQILLRLVSPDLYSHEVVREIVRQPQTINFLVLLPEENAQ